MLLSTVLGSAAGTDRYDEIDGAHSQSLRDDCPAAVGERGGVSSQHSRTKTTAFVGGAVDGAAISECAIPLFCLPTSLLALACFRLGKHRRSQSRGESRAASLTQTADDRSFLPPLVMRSFCALLLIWLVVASAVVCGVVGQGQWRRGGGSDALRMLGTLLRSRLIFASLCPLPLFSLSLFAGTYAPGPGVDCTRAHASSACNLSSHCLWTSMGGCIDRSSWIVGHCAGLDADECINSKRCMYYNDGTCLPL